MKSSIPETQTPSPNHNADASEDPTDLAIPLEYDWEAVSAYWGLRPVAVARRTMTVMLAAAGFGLGAPLPLPSGRCTLKQNLENKLLDT